MSDSPLARVLRCRPDHRHPFLLAPARAGLIAGLVAAGILGDPAILSAQAVERTALDPMVPYLATVANTFRAGTLTAAPRESLPAPSPNPKQLADTSQLAYALWRTDQTAAGAPANSAPHRLMFGRSTDGGRTFSTRAIYTSPGLATSTGYSVPNALPDFHLGAEGHEVFVSFVATLPGNNSPTNIYLLGSQDQGQTWSPVLLANRVTATLGSRDFWANELKMAVTRDPTTGRVRAHLAYEYGDTVIRHPITQGTEAPHHTAFEFVGGSLTVTVTERDISNVAPGQNRDIDGLALTASAGVVLVAWSNDRNTYRGSGTSFNQLFGTVSLDGGATFVPEFLLGDTRPPLGPSNGSLDPTINGTSGQSISPASDFGLAIDAGRLYFLWMDRTHNNGPPTNVIANERLHLYYSHALGVPGTWRRTEVSTYAAGRADIDTIDIAAEGGRVVIAATSDERGRNRTIPGMGGTLSNTPADATVVADNQGSGNHTNQIQIFVSEDAGVTFASQWVGMNSIDDGSVTATQGLIGAVSGSVATLKGTNFVNNKNAMLEMRGDVCHLCFEQEWYGGTTFQGEDLVFWLSLDGGRTWRHRANATMGGGEVRGFTTNPSGAGVLARSDVDLPFLSMTAGGTAIAGVRLELTHGVTGDRPQVFSRSAPLRADLGHVSLARGGTQVQSLDLGPTHAGRLYLIAGSVTGTQPGFPIGGAHIPLQIDPWTNLTINLANTPALPGTRGQLDANGKAQAGIVVPPALASPVLIGLRLYSAALIYDPSPVYHLGTNAVVLELAP